MRCYLHGALFYANNLYADTVHVPYLVSCSLWLVICYSQLSLSNNLFTTSFVYIFPHLPIHLIFSPVIPKMVLKYKLFDNTCYSGQTILQKD